jgi:Flp pilus assembly protein TadD
MALTRDPKAARHHKKLARATVQVSVRPGLSPRAISAYDALRIADEARRQGDFTVASHICGQLADVPVTFTEARIIMLNVALTMNRPREIAQLATEILTRPPKDVYGIDVLAGALREIDRHSQAVDVLDAGIREHPSNATLRAQRGVMHTDMGNRELAERDIRAALKLDPGDLSRYKLLAIASDLTEQEMSMLEASTIPEQYQADVGFALARAHQRRGDADREFHYLDLANAAVGKSTQWSADEDTRLVQQVRETFDSAFFDNHPWSGDIRRRPLFVISMPRSGSTLIEQILASHEDVDAVGETQLFHWVISDLQRRRFPNVPFPQFCPDLTAADIRDLGASYDAGIRETYTAAPMFVDKQLENHLHVGLLAMALPQARFIHAVRNPLDTCLS